jgi:hypothetical protein
MVTFGAYICLTKMKRRKKENITMRREGFPVAAPTLLAVSQVAALR